MIIFCVVSSPVNRRSSTLPNSSAYSCCQCHDNHSWEKKFEGKIGVTFICNLITNSLLTFFLSTPKCKFNSVLPFVSLASSRRSVNWGTARKMASENIGEKLFCLHSTTNKNARFKPNKFILGRPGENQPEPHTFTYTILQSLLTGRTHSNTFKTLVAEHINFHYPY